MRRSFVLFYCKTQCSITASLFLITHHICCFNFQARSLRTSIINYKAVAQIMEKTCNVLCLKQGRQLRYLHLSIFSSKSSSLLWTENIKDIQWKNQHAYTMCMLLNLISFQDSKSIIFMLPHLSCRLLCNGSSQNPRTDFTVHKILHSSVSTLLNLPIQQLVTLSFCELKTHLKRVKKILK